jgi:type IV pilus assembly protein PilB
MLLKDEEIQELLKGIGILDDTKIKLAEQFMKDAHTDFSDALLQLNYITDEKLGISIANHLKIPFVTLSKISIPEEVFHIVPEKIARRKNVIAFARDETGIKLAMADPGDKEIIDMVGHKTQSQVQPYLATERDILNTFYIFKKDLQKSFNALGDPKKKGKLRMTSRFLKLWTLSLRLL